MPTELNVESHNVFVNQGKLKPLIVFDLETK